MQSITYVLWPVSKDCVCMGGQEWVIADSCLELCLLLRGDVYLVYGNVKGVSVGHQVVHSVRGHLLPGSPCPGWYLMVTL